VEINPLLETGATALFLTSPSNRVRCHQQQHREQNNNIFLLVGDLFCLQQRKISGRKRGNEKSAGKRLLNYKITARVSKSWVNRLNM
jgi:hypothetical protein